MMRYLLLLCFIGCSLWTHASTPPVVVESTTEPEVSVALHTGVRITVQGAHVRVQFAEGQQLEVYDIVGKKQALYTLTSADETITLSLPRGYYLLKVGKQVRKIAL